MNKIWRYGFTAIVLTFVMSTLATSANAQINEILKRMDAHYKVLKYLQSDITREKVNTQLAGDVDKMSGTLALRPGTGRNFSLRLEWTKPRNEIISVVNGQYVAYTPGIKQAWIGNSESKTLNDKGGSALKVMSMGKEEIKANYDVQYLGQETISGGIETWHLKLTPKVKSNYKFADLWVDSTGMPLMGRITQLNDDTDSVLLTSLKKNVPFDGSIFNVKLPKDTKIVKG